MSQEVRLKVLGLYTHPNPYSEVPQGALAVADNISIDREGTATPRRGFQYCTGNFGGSSDRATAMTEYGSQVVLHYGNDTLARYNGSAYTDFSGTFAAVPGQTMRFAQASSNLYFTTSAGVKKIDSISGTPGSMGVPKGIQLSGATAGAAGFLPNNHSVAYRVLWGIKDANNNLLLGAPSQRLEVTNSAGGNRDVSLTVNIPVGITTNHFMQVYRSTDTPAAPSDELFLVYEYSPTSGEISAGALTFTDLVPSELLGASLYTNESQEGPLAANDQPPLANDIAVYQEHLFFANTTTKYRYTVTLLGVGGTNGLAADDTITVAGRTYTAKASPATATEFQLFTTLGLDALNIAATARSLVSKVNADASQTTVYAYYLSGPDDLPGKILFEERSIGGSVWTVQISTGSEFAWSPEGLTTAQSATNDDWNNGLFYSKRQQPEAVPILNYLRIGSASDPILRIIPLRNSLFIFKQTEGIYRLSGTDAGNFTVTLFDSSAFLIAPNSLAVLNNQVFGLFSQGVCSVSETGLKVVSRQIERSILELQGQDLAALKAYSWAATYESDRKYILNLISTPGATFPSQAFVLNTFTNAWTRWPVSYGAGFVRPSDDTLYVARVNENRLSKERKSYSYVDYADEALSKTVTAISGNTVSLVTENVSAGDILWQSDSIFALITGVTDSTVTVEYDPGITPGACEVRKGFTSTVQWQPFSAGAPMLKKHWRECAVLFEAQPKLSSISFSTDLIPAFDSVPFSGTSAGGWGSFVWGSLPWGGQNVAKINRTYVTRNHQRAAIINVKWEATSAYSAWAMSGIQLVFNPYQENQRATR